MDLHMRVSSFEFFATWRWWCLAPFSNAKICRHCLDFHESFSQVSSSNFLIYAEYCVRHIKHIKWNKNYKPSSSLPLCVLIIYLVFVSSLLVVLWWICKIVCERESSCTAHMFLAFFNNNFFLYEKRESTAHRSWWFNVGWLFCATAFNVIIQQCCRFLKLIQTRNF